MTVYQAVASYVPHDAVTEAARRFREILEPGVRERRVIADGISRELAGEAISYRSMERGRPEDVIVYHVSTDSPLASWLADRPERLIVYYHNLTPAEFLAPYDPRAARRLNRARAEASALAGFASAAAAPSHYSTADLRKWGYDDVRVLPYPVSLSGAQIDEKVLRALKAGKGAGGDLLFVGRLTPNKAQDDLLRAAAARSRRAAGSRVFLVGGTHLRLYERYLRELALKLGISTSSLVGPVSPQGLAAHYANADVFVSLSRHEGFGVPIVEAMAAGVPVVALRAAAVPETVGDAGLLLDSAEPALVAEVVERVLTDSDLRFELIEAGTERASDLTDPAVVRRSLTELVSA